MVSVIGEGIITKATALGSLGRMRESEALLKGALAFAEDYDLPASQMRARLNLSNSMWITDPRQGLEVARSGIEIARRLGNRPWYVLLANNAIACATRTGDWDWALEREAELRALDLEPADLLSLTDTPIIRACRGIDVSDAVAELEEPRPLPVRPVTGRGTASSPCVARARHRPGRFALQSRDAGRARQASQSWASPPRSPAHAGAWAGDLDGVRSADAALERTGVHGPAIEASRRTIRATIAGMEGRPSEAGAGFRDAARQWRDLGLNSTSRSVTWICWRRSAPAPAARARLPMRHA